MERNYFLGALAQFELGIFVAQARQKKKILPWLTLFEKLGSSSIFLGVREHVLEFSMSSLFLWPLSCVIFGGMNLHLPLEMIPFTWRRRFCLLRRRQPFSSHSYDDYLVAFGPMKSRKK